MLAGISRIKEKCGKRGSVTTTLDVKSFYADGLGAREIKTHVSLDKVVVLGRATPFLSTYLQRRISNFNELPFSVSSWGNCPARSPFRYYFSFTDGTFLQLGQGKAGMMPAVRIEFNPNKSDWRDLGGLGALLSFVRFVRFSRYDFAIDYFDLDLSAVRWEDLGHSHSTVTYRGCTGRLETHYIGSRRSDNQIRVYDKGLEQGKPSDVLWWRVESQYRPEGVDLGETFFLRPFDHIKGYSGISGDGLNWQDRIILERLSVDDSIFGEMSQYQRSKYRKLLDSCSVGIPLQPSEVFDQSRFSISDEIKGIHDLMQAGAVDVTHWEETVEKVQEKEENNNNATEQPKLPEIASLFDFAENE